ncbi:AraC family ligand binding domain-containing protein [Staphylococcus cohnii]|nr:AraC family ligand binding domain-containing protein [Staphylococcus cohnii]
MEEFIYKKSGGITALSANITDFSYKNHSHSEYAIGVTKSGIQRYHLDGKLQLSYQDGIMLFNPEQVHDGMVMINQALNILCYILNQLYY